LKGLADHVDAARAAWGAAAEEAERQGVEVLTARAAGANGVVNALDRLLFASLAIRGGPLLLPILLVVLPWLKPRALWWPGRAQVWRWGGLRRRWVAVRGRTPVCTQPRRGLGEACHAMPCLACLHACLVLWWRYSVTSIGEEVIRGRAVAEVAWGGQGQIVGERAVGQGARPGGARAAES
jgi:hypothetical protein